MVIEIKKGDSPADIRKKLQEAGEKSKAKREDALKAAFGILKQDMDPLKLQRQWRNEWE